MYDDICKLIKVQQGISILGDTIDTAVMERTVFCRVKSYNARDKFQGLNEGEIPELTIVLADKGEYLGEDKVEYKNTTYKVIRTSFDDLHNDIGLVVTKWK